MPVPSLVRLIAPDIAPAILLEVLFELMVNAPSETVPPKVTEPAPELIMSEPLYLRTAIPDPPLPPLLFEL